MVNDIANRTISLPTMGHLREAAPRSWGVPQPDLPARPITVLTLLNCFKRVWRSSLVLGSIIGLAFAAFVWYFLPTAKPYAFVKLFLPTEQRGMNFEHPDVLLSQQTHKELMLSRLVLKPAMTAEEIKDLTTVKSLGDPAGWASRELKVDFIGPEIVKLTLEGDVPEDLKLIVDSIKDTYLKMISSRATNDRQSRLDVLGSALLKAKADLEKLQSDLRRKSTETGSVDRQLMALKQKNSLELLSTAQKELTTIQSDLKRLAVEEETLRKRKPEDIELLPTQVEAGLDNDLEVVDAMNDRRKLAIELEQKMRFLIAEHPEVKRVKKEVELVEAREKVVREERRPIVEHKLKDKAISDAKVRLDSIAGDLAKLQSLEKGQQALVDQYIEQSSKLNSATWTVEGSQLDYLQAQDRVRNLETSYEKLKFEFTTPTRVQALEDASIVRVNDASRRMKLAMVAAMFGVALTFLGFAFKEYRAHRLETSHDLSELQLPLVGNVPRIDDKVAQGESNDVAWENIISEAFDSARTIFLHTVDQRHLRAILVSSSLPGEGKTSVSYRLALSLARSGKKVLLVDGDLRDPSIHARLGIPVGPGLADCLKNQVSLDDAIRVTSLSNFGVLTAGAVDRAAIEELNRGGFNRLVSEMREKFDYLLLDSSPILPVADTLLMARAVDAVMLSLMCEVSQVERVQEACQKLEGIGVPVIGAIVNGSRNEAYGYAVNGQLDLNPEVAR
jgi:polysaccharide biosynthesis transport protein